MSVSDLPYPGNAESPPRRLQAPRPDLSLWWCVLEAEDDAVATFTSWLSPAEHARAARYGVARLKRQYTIGRGTLRWILARRLDAAPGDIGIERGRRGRPQLADASVPDFNVSNTRGIALIGMCETPGVRIGVDIEHAEREVNHAGLARKFLTPREQAALVGIGDDEERRTFLRLWTCKEAMSKATGDALSAPFRRLDVELLPKSALLGGPPPYLPEHWTLLPVEVPEGFIATIAIWQHHG